MITSVETNQHTCDRCAKTVVAPKDTPPEEWLSITIRMTEYDLCPSCARKLQKWMTPA